MLFVGASWGANLPVTKVMLGHFDLMPMAAMRTPRQRRRSPCCCGWSRAAVRLRIDLPFGRFAALGFMMGGFFAVYAFGL